MDDLDNVSSKKKIHMDICAFTLSGASSKKNVNFLRENMIRWRLADGMS